MSQFFTSSVKYWSFSFSISPSKEHPGLISLQSKGLSRVFSNTTVQKHQLLGAQLSLDSALRKDNLDPDPTKDI